MYSFLARRSLGFFKKDYSFGSPLRAGQKLRLAQGRGRSGNEDGPIHDLSDFHFADGRPAPITPKQELWRKKTRNGKTTNNISGKRND
jgi:hypothetical protein